MPMVSLGDDLEFAFQSDIQREVQVPFFVSQKLFQILIVGWKPLLAQ